MNASPEVRNQIMAQAALSPSRGRASRETSRREASLTC
jgi:hypothetical protein